MNSNPRNLWSLLGLGGAILVTLLAFKMPKLQEAVERNQLAIKISKTWIGSEDNLPVELGTGGDPFQIYVRGLQEMRLGNMQAGEDYWATILGENIRYVQLARARLPTSPKLAQKAVKLYPDKKIAWQWLGDTSPSDSLQALEAYTRAAQIDPFDNLTWEQIASLALRLNQPEVAFQAASKACQINTIRNGTCHTAARIAFDDADWENVIYYFVRGSYPEYSQDWALLICAATRLGRSEDAARYLGQAQMENPDDYGALLAEKCP